MLDDHRTANHCFGIGNSVGQTKTDCFLSIILYNENCDAACELCLIYNYNIQRLKTISKTRKLDWMNEISPKDIICFKTDYTY